MPAGQLQEPRASRAGQIRAVPLGLGISSSFARSSFCCVVANSNLQSFGNYIQFKVLVLSWSCLRPSLDLGLNKNIKFLPSWLFTSQILCLIREIQRAYSSVGTQLFSLSSCMSTFFCTVMLLIWSSQTFRWAYLSPLVCSLLLREK